MASANEGIIKAAVPTALATKAVRDISPDSIFAAGGVWPPVFPVARADVLATSVARMRATEIFIVDGK